MADHGLRLRPGAYETVKKTLNAETDRDLAARLSVSYETARKAKAASADQNIPAPFMFVSAANRATNFPLDALMYSIRETRAAA